ncbi:MAG: hypothetical protein JW747_06040 [Candidatus Aminicenantes bacterium]|nr:hypothetical protein [Candidatus Aminicenantes bacterium]
MDITVREVKSRRDRRDFLFLPERIHAGHKTWVHPLYMDEKNYFDPGKNRAFSYCDTRLLLAYEGKELRGRAMGIVNRRYNEERNEKTARFGYLETYEDFRVVETLLRALEDWARGLGMTKMIGPYGFSDQDPEGFLIEGFEHRATIATYHNFPWMPAFVERLGYDKDIDYFVYQLDVPDEIPDLYKKVSERILRRGNFRVIEFRKKKEIKPWIRRVLGLMNECYSQTNIYGYSPLDEKEMDALAKRYLPVLDVRFVKVVEREGEIVAFVIAMPDMTGGIRAARGRLFPFGFLKILRAAKKTKQLDLLLGAVKDKYRGMGLDALMGSRMLASAREAGYEIMDTHHEMEANVRVRAEMERMGGRLYKKFRVYKKSLV